MGLFMLYLVACIVEHFVTKFAGKRLGTIVFALMEPHIRNFIEPFFTYRTDERFVSSVSNQMAI